MLTIVTGPPCAGKTTYVTSHRLPGDIVIDFDDLAQAFGSPVRHGHTDAIWCITVEARNAAIFEAINWHRRGSRVWIIDTAPSQRRCRQYDEACAKWVRLTATREELHRRAAAERPPDWHARIDQWLDSGGREVPSAGPARPPRSQVRTRW